MPELGLYEPSQSFVRQGNVSHRLLCNWIVKLISYAPRLLRALPPMGWIIDYLHAW
jgi:hypothetical protein